MGRSAVSVYLSKLNEPSQKATTSSLLLLHVTSSLASSDLCFRPFIYVYLSRDNRRFLFPSGSCVVFPSKQKGMFCACDDFENGSSNLSRMTSCIAVMSTEWTGSYFRVFLYWNVL